MNVRVDLIIPAERRSAGPLNTRMLLRIARIVAPLVVVTLVGIGVLNAITRNNELQQLRGRWARCEPELKAAKLQGEEARRALWVLGDLNGWAASRIDWNAQLVGLMRNVPASVQLREVKINQVLKLGERDVPARAFTMTVTGKTKGATADVDVGVLQDRLHNASPFAGTTAEVEVLRYGADTDRGAGRDDRAFLISVTYKDRLFK